MTSFKKIIRLSFFLLLLPISVQANNCCEVACHPYEGNPIYDCFDDNSVTEQNCKARAGTDATSNTFSNFKKDAKCNEEKKCVAENAIVAPTEKKVSKPMEFIFNVPLPGLNQTMTVNNNSLSTYINWLYKFLVGVAGLLALFMVTIGALFWLFAGGNSAQISTGKNYITGAVIGLFLAIASYSILYIINPQLLNNQFPIIVSVKDAQLDDNYNDPGGTTKITWSNSAASTVLTRGNGSGPNGFVIAPNFSANLANNKNIASGVVLTPNMSLGNGQQNNGTAASKLSVDGLVCYKQGWQPWGSLIYGKKCSKIPNSTIGDAGCGPSSLAMVVSTLKKITITPDASAGKIDDRGGRICGAGTSQGAILDSAIKDFGLNATEVNWNGVSNCLNSNGLVIALTRGPKRGKPDECASFTQGGHYVVIGKINNGQVEINDSANSLITGDFSCYRSESEELVKKCADRFWCNKLK